MRKPTRGMRNVRPGTSRNRPGAEAEGEEGAYEAPPKKNNTPVIVGIVAGAVVLLIIIIVAASSGGGRRAAPRAYPEPEQNVAPLETEKPKSNYEGKAIFGGQRLQDTGAIMFVCANSGSHDDKEVEVMECDNCHKKRMFVAYENQFFCYNCEKKFPKESLKCDECGRPPQKGMRIKHK